MCWYCLFVLQFLYSVFFYDQVSDRCTDEIFLSTVLDLVRYYCDLWQSEAEVFLSYHSGKCIIIHCRKNCVSMNCSAFCTNRPMDNDLNYFKPFCNLLYIKFLKEMIQGIYICVCALVFHSYARWIISLLLFNITMNRGQYIINALTLNFKMQVLIFGYRIP